MAERTPSLGDKMQRLAWMARDKLADIEDQVDFALRNCADASMCFTIEHERLDDAPADPGISAVVELMARQAPTVLTAWRDSRPIAGWNARTRFSNPRTPSVPASLELTLEEYFAAAALVGLLSAQQDEPDMTWASKWASDMGKRMATESRKRRRRQK